VAALCARAAADEAADHWLSGLDIGSQWVVVFVQRLRELGWIEGHTVAIEYRWAEGRKERAGELAAEFVQLKVDLIMTYGTQCALAAKQATNSVPIVFALPGDPVATGLVATLARPGSNITGVSSQGTELGTKRLQILRETVPGLRRLAIMGNVDNPASVLDMAKVHECARPHRRSWPAGSDRGLRWPSRLVAEKEDDVRSSPSLKSADWICCAHVRSVDARAA